MKFDFGFQFPYFNVHVLRRNIVIYWQIPTVFKPIRRVQNLFFLVLKILNSVPKNCDSETFLILKLSIEKKKSLQNPIKLDRLG